MVEESVDFTPLLLVSILAVAVPFVAWRLTGGLLPAVVGEVLVGILFGEPVLGIITHENEWLTFLGLFGFAYLMFLSGLEINLGLLGQSPGRRWYVPRVALRHPLISGVVLLALVVVFTYVGLHLMSAVDLINASQIPMLLFILIATAVGVIVPVLKDRPDLGRMGQSLLVGGFLLEFVAIVGVGVVAALEREGISWKIFLILAVPAALIVMVWLSRFGSGRFPIIPRTLHELAQTSSQLKIRASLALLVIFVALSQVAGTEMVLGAFVAGLAVTVVSPRHGSALRGKLDALGYGFFVPIFFIHAGATLDLGAVFDSAESLILVPALLLVAFGAKMLPSLIGLAPAWGVRPGLAGGSLLSANLSLVLAAGAIAADLGVIDDGLHGALLLMALLTTVLAPPMFSTIAGRTPEQEDGHTLIVGGGDLARTLAERLMAGGRRVIVLDRDPEASTKWSSLGVEGVVGDPLDALTLISVRLLQTDVAVIVDFDEPDQVIGYTQSMRRIHPTLRVVTWVSEPDIQFEQIDVEVHSLSDVTALALEEAVLRPGLHAARSDPESGLVEVELLNREFDGQTLAEVDFEGDVRVLVVMREGESSVATGDTSIFMHDRLTLAGEPTAVALMSSRFQQRNRHRWLIDVRAGRQSQGEA
ncbi:MAG: hypothetical protein F4066_01820 [Chloroflexi bacterium]|nr:hypothetical protein [Chloroflexota bacterium]MYB21544.1 hypothetical protein [Chloroflexota bacterium]MYD16059.1 hypothetical protein [Chloroflexota bacterium]MYF82235.1 hypothetical protein [Chloroflexota bacterium]MYI03586.1 hypothetical protein [Chloroflexota bacterium]